MSTSAVARRRDEIASLAAPRLTAVGFRRQRAQFVRETEPGFIQVIAFALAPSSSVYYGQLSIDLGIYIAEVAECLGQPTRRPTIADCELRSPCGVLQGARAWNLLSAATDDAWPEVQAHLHGAVLTHLDRHRTRAALCDAQLAGEQPGFPPRGDLAVAVMLATGGETKRAHAVLTAYLQQIKQPTHREWAEQIAAGPPFR